MKRLILGSVVTLLMMAGPAAASCLYQGIPYSEGARICIHRTMFMCRGRRWVRTAERCWERYSGQASPFRHAWQRPPDALAMIKVNVTTCDSVAAGADRTRTLTRTMVNNSGAAEGRASQGGRRVSSETHMRKPLAESLKQLLYSYEAQPQTAGYVRREVG